MMVDNQLSELPTGFVGTSAAATGNMSLFPHETAACVTVKVNDPEGDAYSASDKDGYILYKHDITADNSTADLVNYMATEMAKGTYYIDASGTVTQESTGYE